MNKIGKVIGIMSPIALIACFLPFLILCFYCFPSVDDYSYGNIAESYGFVGAQIHWYTTWTGRYFATAVLSTVPLLISNFTLYHLFSLALLLGSLHSIYFFIRSFKIFSDSGGVLILALSALLSYLLFLPDITEAFYWFPGSVTYQLATVLATYVVGMAIRIELSGVAKWKDWAIMCILAFLIVGSNEVVMVVMAICVTLYYLYALLRYKEIFNGRFVLFMVTLIGSLFMVLAPGNNLRAENDIKERSFDQLNEAFLNSLSDVSIFLGEYFWIPVLPLLLLSMLYFANVERAKVKWIHLIIALTLIYALIFAVIFPTYYVYKMAAPLRTQNFNLWILVIGTIFLGRILSPLVLKMWSLETGRQFRLGSLVFLICIFLFSGYNGVTKAYSDLISGSAKDFENQYKHRIEMLSNCEDTICVLPAYTAYPYTTFHSDLDISHENWWNYLYGRFNGNKQISVDYSDLIPVYTYSLDFSPSHITMENYNIENLTDSVSLNGDYSYYMSPEVMYGGGLSFNLDTLNINYGHQPAYLKISADAFFKDTLRNLHVVSIINTKGGKSLSWRSVTWVESKALGSGWEEAEILIPLYSLDLHLNDELKIFLWNPEKRDAYVDNITFTLY